MELVVAGWLLLGGWLLAPATAVRCYTDLMKTKVTSYHTSETVKGHTLMLYFVPSISHVSMFLLPKLFSFNYLSCNTSHLNNYSS